MLARPFGTVNASAPIYERQDIINSEPIAKAYRLSADGERVEKDAEACSERLSACRDARTVRRAGTLREHAAAFDAFTTSHAATYGVTRNGNPDCRLVSKGVAAREGIGAAGTADVALRTRECFEYPAGPALFMADHDPKGDSARAFIPPGSHPLCGKALDRGALRDLLCEVEPRLGAAPMIVRPSGSTWIRRTSDGKQLRGEGGVRVLIGVSAGVAIPAMAARLFGLFEAAGLLHIEFSKNGSLLVRCPIDMNVFQPERFDFIGGAEVGAGLERNPPKSELYNADAAPFDFLANVSSAQAPDVRAKHYEGAVERLREARKAFATRARERYPEVRATAAAIRAEWLAERIATATAAAERAKGGALTVEERVEIEAQHKRIEQALEHGRQPFLLGSFVLPLGGGVTVADVLTMPGLYVGVEFADPLEPDYDGGRAVATILIGEDGEPYIVSQAHGAHGIRLCRTLWDLPAPVIEQCATVSAAGVDSLLQALPTRIVTHYRSEHYSLTYKAHGVFPSEHADGFTLPARISDDDAVENARDARERPPHTLVIVQPTWFVSPADARAEQPAAVRLATGVYTFKPHYTTLDPDEAGRGGGDKVFAGWKASRLCSAVVSYAEATAEGKRAIVLLVRDAGHQWHRADVQSSEYSKGGRLESLLRTAGLHGFKGAQWKDVQDLLGYQQVRCVKADLLHTLGWVDGRFEQYALPQGLVSATLDSSARPSVAAYSKDVRDSFDRTGTYAAWLTAAAGLAHDDWLFSTALAASFAPPLLRPLGVTGAGLHVWGPSGAGKSTPLRLARSVWGPCALTAWDATYNGAVAAAVVAQDSLTAYDEVGSASDKSVPPRLAYALVNGSERTRANQDGSARAPRQFRTVVLSCGEYTMRDAAIKSGAAYHEGQEVRFLDVAAELDETRSPRMRMLGTEAFGRTFGPAIEQAYGHAGPLFIQQLFRFAGLFKLDVQGLARAAHKHADAMMMQAPGGVADNVKRARQQFVLFAAAGELAIATAVLGEHWNTGDMIKACGQAFAAWMKGRAEHGDLSLSGETTRAQRELRSLVERTPGQWVDVKNSLHGMQVGWARELPGVGTAYFIQDGMLKREQCEFDGAALTRLLAGCGMTMNGARTVGKAAGAIPVRLGGKLVKVRGFVIPEETAAGAGDVEADEADEVAAGAERDAAFKLHAVKVN
ncbi:DUF927 domain-containing protein [Paraburkholderia mimosarum]|uniref:DUF927 domain-containing protein n=1 Tax=Paraburkholderia mimosarum TaxID=312026 RepID=UPI0003FDDF52|nr:DUF927 domain-containing protein [Paraburkholderia mimosarum]